MSRSQHGTTYRRTLLHSENWTLWGLLLRGAEVAYTFDEYAPCRFLGVARKVGDSVTTGYCVETKKSWVLYTDSGNESFCLISWMGKYFFCLDVPAFIHNWLHFMLEKKTRSSSRMSVSRAATTTSSVSAWMQCSTTLVSASSCLALSISMSTNGSVHWVSSAVRNPPATTVILSPGAWAISSLESRSARSCLLEGTARKSFQFCRRLSSW